jgi:hypothetical protein
LLPFSPTELPFWDARSSDIKVPMAKQTVISRKRRGPAPTGKGAPTLVRLQPDLAGKIDAWSAKQEDAPSRPEAIRRLIDLGLKTKR